MNDFFTAIGQFIGHVIRFIVDALGAGLNGLDDAASSLIGGIAGGLGIPANLLSLLVLALGLWLLWKAFSALRRRAVVATLIWVLLGVSVLSWLIN
ncbi:MULTISPECIES: hypothetical protein [Halomonas]|uniref:MFS transporter n=1 Tax=Halomonas halophila TaxID=29573 RepID=A0ABQ0U2Y2_9GAMM|nr:MULTISPECIES: hypothetical protein [Halomonas]MDR5890159.1 hypothetical protein [Halomonas salina]RAH37945.1 hypothetical protein C9J49_008215 [Halomonas sp. SL1]WJY06581.1 hypothetical protein QWG60_12840 [Halomonas halophila]GEK72767.1 hypothetical protein HHA04nite_13110 [Halomonas halophila]